MVATAAAFFRADNAVKQCEERRLQHVVDRQERHANAVLHFHLLSEELEGLVTVRKGAREKANEAHSYQSEDADDDDDDTRGEYLDDMSKSGLFSAEQVESLCSKQPPLPTIQVSPTSTSNSFSMLQEQSESEKGKPKWHFNPVFSPAAEDVSHTDLPTQLPEKAFPNLVDHTTGDDARSRSPHTGLR